MNWKGLKAKDPAIFKMLKSEITPTVLGLSLRSSEPSFFSEIYLQRNVHRISLVKK